MGLSVLAYEPISAAYEDGKQLSVPAMPYCSLQAYIPGPLHRRADAGKRALMFSSPTGLRVATVAATEDPAIRVRPDDEFHGCAAGSSVSSKNALPNESPAT
jgi:hypothetical protein